MAAPHKHKLYFLLVDNVELSRRKKPLCAHFLFLVFLQIFQNIEYTRPNNTLKMFLSASVFQKCLEIRRTADWRIFLLSFLISVFEVNAEKSTFGVFK